MQQRSSSIKTRQQGVALITALLVVSMATVLAVALVNHLYLDVRRTENIIRLDQAQLYNNSATEIVRELLTKDLKERNKYDSLQEFDEFNAAFLYPVDGGSISGKLTDLQSCFNLNNLATVDKDLTRYRAQYLRLLNNLGIDIAQQALLTDSLIDWLDTNDISSPQGAEFDYYIGLVKPYRTANSLLVSPSELLLIKGYTPNIVNRIKNCVCVLPTTKTAININTASLEMLESIEGLAGLGNDIIQSRDGDPGNPEDDSAFNDIKSFTRVVTDLGVKKFDATGLQVYTEYFLLESRARLGTGSSAGNIKLFSIIFRDNSNAKTKLLRQTSGAL